MCECRILIVLSRCPVTFEVSYQEGQLLAGHPPLENSPHSSRCARRPAPSHSHCQRLYIWCSVVSLGTHNVAFESKTGGRCIERCILGRRRETEAVSKTTGGPYSVYSHLYRDSYSVVAFKSTLRITST